MTQEDNKMITEYRLKHILGVARKAKEIASKICPDDEKYAQDMFVLGLLHDVGYEFLETGQGHAKLGGEILERSDYKYSQEIINHGYSENTTMTDELFILNCADMTVGVNGKTCSMSERLKDIGVRYGINSQAYNNASLEIKKLQSDQRYLKLL